MSVTIGDGVIFTVEIGFAYSGSPGLQPAGGLWANVTWTDVSAYVRGVQTNRGRSSELDSFQTGHATVVLNNRDRRFDPEYTAGPYYGSLTPMRPIRIKADYQNGIPAILFAGFVDGWPQAYDYPDDSVVTVTCSDAFKVLNYINLTSYWEYAIRNENLATTWWRMDDGPTFQANYDTIQKVQNTYWSDTTISGTSLVQDDPGTAAVFDASRYLQFAKELLYLNTRPAIVGYRKVGIEFWMQTSQTDAGGVAIFSLGEQIPSQTSMGIRMTGTVGTVVVTQGTYNPASSGLTVWTHPTTVNDGKPHHVAFVYDQSTSTGTLYVDGVAGSSTTATEQADTYRYTNLIGYPISTSTTAGYNFTSYFDGTIDEVILYNNVTLPTAAQILAHYQIGMGQYQAGETTGARIGRILDLAQWPSDARAVSTGSSTVQGITVNGKSALSLLQECEAAEQGRLFINGLGQVAFVDRKALYSPYPYVNSPQTTSQYTFGDSGSELRYTDIGFSYSDQLIKNSVRVGKANGGSVTVTDATSISKYWKRSDSLDSLNISSEYIAADIANARLQFYKDPSLRVESLRFSPRRSPSTLYDPALSAEITTRITVKRRPQGVGTAISKELFIEGISHTIGPRTWETTFLLSPVTTTYFILNDNTNGVLDTSRLGY